MMNKRIDSLKKNPFVKGFFLFLPYPLVFVAIVCIVVVLFQTFIEPSAYFRLLAYDKIDPSVTIPEAEEGEFPVIPYESQWATLNVEGWSRKDIKVFFGDNNTLLRKGAGMWINSRFCGQNGKIVLSAHVTSDFHELEVTPVGTRITMDTVYGQYVYEVADTLIFHYQDETPLMPQDGEEILFMYTCYPRKNGHLFKTQRMALICKKVEGKEWSNDF